MAGGPTVHADSVSGRRSPSRTEAWGQPLCRFAPPVGPEPGRSRDGQAPRGNGPQMLQAGGGRGAAPHRKAPPGAAPSLVAPRGLIRKGESTTLDELSGGETRPSRLRERRTCGRYWQECERREDDSDMSSPAPGCGACATGLLIKGPGAASSSSQISHSPASEVTAKPAGLRCACGQLGPGMAEEQRRRGKESGGDSPGEAVLNVCLRGHKHPRSRAQRDGLLLAGQ